jgi:hypothetical protein
MLWQHTDPNVSFAPCDCHLTLGSLGKETFTNDCLFFADTKEYE